MHVVVSSQKKMVRIEPESSGDMPGDARHLTPIISYKCYETEIGNTELIHRIKKYYKRNANL
ncbi:hypothetical protein GSbR_25620 [Geobacter sp. SVR]|nr:hypothetical protein GSVR_24870 [Geobacter sp. SVR]GCF85962.1 hypothetical protein GSbR_25620 [Geobacter sp. SVR]